MQIKKQNEEVFFADGKFIEIKRGYIESLKEKCSSNKSGKARLCAHRDTDSPIHEMLIVHAKNTYVRPHRHLNKIESFHVIEGSARVIIFNEEGEIIKVTALGDYSSGNNFYWRFAEPYYHTLIIDSDFLVFHEITNGPFNRVDTVFPSWAPADSDKLKSDRYMNKMGEEADMFLKKRKD